MSPLKIVVTVLFIIVSVFLTILVLMQEGKDQGLGSIGGAAQSYWGKNKSRSMEGMLVKVTRILAIVFLVLTVVLNIGSFV